MIPSSPTRPTASAISLPMAASPLALTVATFAMSRLPFTRWDIFATASTTRATPVSMPRLSASGW